MSTDTNNNERSAVELLQEINSGMTDPKSLDKQARQSCLETLRLEGYTASQAASVLRVSEKTILRDLKQIRERNSLTPNIEFAKELTGQFFQWALSHHDYLTRLARSKDGHLSEKAQCEYAAWKVLRETIETLQMLGYLPTMPSQFELMVENRNDEQSLEDLKAKIFVIETTAKECGSLTPEVAEKIGKLKLRVEKYEVAETALKLLEEQKSKIEEQEETDEQKN
jgi:transposase